MCLLPVFLFGSNSSFPFLNPFQVFSRDWIMTLLPMITRLISWLVLWLVCHQLFSLSLFTINV